MVPQLCKHLCAFMLGQHSAAITEKTYNRFETFQVCIRAGFKNLENSRLVKNLAFSLDQHPGKSSQDFEIDNKALSKFLKVKILEVILPLLFFSLLFHPLPYLLVQREPRLESRNKQECQEVSRIVNLDKILWGFAVVLFSSSRPSSALYQGQFPKR